jgi:hypothetical protein
MIMYTPCPRLVARAAATAVLALVGLTAGCGNSSNQPAPLPAAESFSPGVCRTLAPDLLDTLRIVRAGDDTPAGTRSTARSLIPSQERLYDRIATAGEYSADVERVTTAVGFLRLRVDVGTYSPALRGEVGTAAERLVDRCT